jgi:hypothetical protein
MAEKQVLKDGDWIRDILSDEVARVCNISDIEGNEHSLYPLVTNINGSRHTMTRDGKILSEHKNPRFVKCDPPKKKVTKTIEAWANVYPDQAIVWRLKESADQIGSDNRIACVKLTGTYEVLE